MIPKFFRRAGVWLAMVFVLTLGGSGLDSARATSSVWTGLGSDNTWTNTGNWSPAAVPNGANDTATFTNNSPVWTNVNLGPASITLSNFVIASGAPAFSFSSGAGNVYLLIPANGDITVSAGVTNVEDLSAIPLIRGASGTSTAFNVANNGTALLKLPVLTQYTGSGNVRIVFSGASGTPISATVNDRGTQTTEALLNAPVVVYLQDTGNNGNFNGGLFIRAGTVSTASVALNSVGHSPLGTGNTVYVGSDDNTGQTSTVQYTGAGSGTTDEQFDLTKGNLGIFDITNAAANLILTTSLNEANSSSTTLSGNLSKLGAGTLTLNAKASYTGTTTVANGTLSLGAANAISTSGNLTLGGSGTAGVLDLGGFSQQLGVLAVAGPAVAANQVVTNSSAANPATLVFSNATANPSVFGGVIVNGTKPVSLTVLGGSLTLTNVSTYSGKTTVTAGTLALGAGGSLADTAAILVNTNALFNVAAGGFTLAAGQMLAGYGVITGAVTAAGGLISPGTNGVAGTLTFTNGLTMTGGVTNYFDLGLTPGAAGNDLIVVGGALNVSGTNTIQVNPLGASLSAGTYSLIKFGSLAGGGATNFQVTGTLGASLQAAINVTASEVDLVVSQVGGTQRTWAGDGQVNAWDDTTPNWQYGGVAMVYGDGDFVTFDNTGSSSPPVNLTAVLQPAAVLVNATANYTFSGPGAIAGAAALTKTNTGTLTILTTNSYAGLTTLAQGVLQLGNGTASGSTGTNAIQNAGTLVLDLAGPASFANLVAGPGNLVQAGPGTLTLTAGNTYTGGTTISAGTLQLNTGGWFGSGNVTNNGALVFNSTGNVNVSAILSGPGGVTLANTGTVTLTGGNTYGGGTTVSKGTLLVNNPAGSGTGGGAVVVGNGATLGGGGVIGGPVTINSGGIYSPGNPVGTLTVSNSFTAAAGAVLDYTLGATSDRTVVGGDLSLSGTLNITAGTGFTSGTNTLFTYGGALTLGALTLNLPANTTGTLSTNIPGQVNLMVGTLQSNIPAFPGAYGFGANATGARFGGSVYHVTNTNDSGTGSFRDAVSKPNRFVVFDVGGTITLASAVSCSSSLTVAGQTAPGGIAIIGHEVSFSVLTNEIVRYLRIRPGSIASSTEDGINMGDGTNMIYDHVSIEFAPYNTIDAHGNYTCGNDITIQNSILADPIGQQFNAHTEASNNTFSWIGNIFSSGHDRNPLAKVNNVFINNVVNNFQAGYTVANTGGNFSHDIINNYFITGPATTSAGDDFFQFDSNQSVYASGNLLDSANNGTLGGSTTAPGGVNVLNAPWSALTPGIPTYATTAAYRVDVSQSGALPRDDVDANVLGDVTSLGTAGMGVGLWTTQASTGLANDGYGVITPGTLPVDTDSDGVPDYFEMAVGSNPNVADSLTPGTGGYTKLENYLNWLAGPHVIAPVNSRVNVDLWPYTGGFTNDNPVYAVSAPTNGRAVLLADGHTAQFTATGNFSGLGSFNFSVRAADGSAMTNTVGVCVTPETGVQSLTWRGDGTANNWDTNSPNWFNGTNLIAFYAGDPVTFDDTGSSTPVINLSGPLAPGSVTVAANQNYTLGGGGSLAGGMSLTKVGAGVLTLTGAHTYSGQTTVSNGTLLVSGSIAANVTVMGGAALGGPGTFGGAVTYNAGSYAVFTNGAPTTFGGALTVAGGGTLPVVKLNLPAGLGAGTWTLATFPVAGSSGAFNATPMILSGGVTPGVPVVVTTSGGIISLTVSRATPAISNSPSATALTYGQPLGAATVTGTVTNTAGVVVPGTFAFAAPATIPAAGTSSEPVVFTPTDATDYSPVTASVPVTVHPAALTITADNASKVYGQTVTFAGTEFTTAGLVNGDTVTGVTLTSAGATNTAAPGGYPIVAGAAAGGGLGNYTISYVAGTLTVTAATPVTINPPVMPGDGSLQLTFTGGDAGVSYRVQGSTDLFNWINLITNVAGAGGLPGFTDFGAGTNLLQFYRTVSP